MKMKKAKKSQNWKVKVFQGFVVILIACSILLFTELKKPMTIGYSIFQEKIYTDYVNLTITKNQEFEWSPQNVGELNSISISGEIIGKGIVKVYIENDGKKYLLFDSQNKSKISQMPTFSIHSGEITIDMLVSPVEEINQSLDNLTESEFFSSKKNETKNENTTKFSSDVTDLTNVTNLTNLTNELKINSSESVTYKNETEIKNETTFFEDNKTNLTEEIREKFERVCTETCYLSGFNKTKYKLIFEIENGTILKIYSISYSLKEKIDLEDIFIGVPKKLTRGKTTEFIAVVTNRGSATAKDVVLSWALPESLEIVKGEANKTCGDLPSGESCVSKITVMAKFSAKLGKEEIKFHVDYKK